MNVSNLLLGILLQIVEGRFIVHVEASILACCCSAVQAQATVLCCRLLCCTSPPLSKAE